MRRPFIIQPSHSRSLLSLSCTSNTATKRIITSSKCYHSRINFISTEAPPFADSEPRLTNINSAHKSFESGWHALSESGKRKGGERHKMVFKARTPLRLLDFVSNLFVRNYSLLPSRQPSKSKA